MFKHFKYDTKQGMLKYTYDMTKDDIVVLLVLFESYDTGVLYKTKYTSQEMEYESKDIKLIHNFIMMDLIFH